MSVSFVLCKEGNHVNIKPVVDFNMQVLNEKFGNFYSKVLKGFQDQGIPDFEILCFLKEDKDIIFVNDLISLQGKIVKENSFSVLEVLFGQYLSNTDIFKLSKQKPKSLSQVGQKKCPDLNIKNMDDFNQKKIIDIQTFLSNVWEYSGDKQAIYSEIIDGLNYVYSDIQQRISAGYYNSKKEEATEFVCDRLLTIMGDLCTVSLDKNNQHNVVSLFFEIFTNSLNRCYRRMFFSYRFNVVFMKIIKYLSVQQKQTIFLETIKLSDPTFNVYRGQDNYFVNNMEGEHSHILNFYKPLSNLNLDYSEYSPSQEFEKIVLSNIYDSDISEKIANYMKNKNLLGYKKQMKIEDSQAILKIIEEVLENDEEFWDIWYAQALLLSVYCERNDLFYTLYKLRPEIATAFLYSAVKTAYGGDSQYRKGQLCEIIYSMVGLQDVNPNNHIYKTGDEVFEVKDVLLYDKIKLFLSKIMQTKQDLFFSLIFNEKPSLLCGENHYSPLFSDMLEIADGEAKDVFLNKLREIAEKIMDIKPTHGVQHNIRGPLGNFLKTPQLYKEEGGKTILLRLLDYYYKYYNNIGDYILINMVRSPLFIRENKNYVLEIWSKFKTKTNLREELAKSHVLPKEIYDNLAKSRSSYIQGLLCDESDIEII